MLQPINQLSSTTTTITTTNNDNIACSRPWIVSIKAGFRLFRRIMRHIVKPIVALCEPLTASFYFKISALIISLFFSFWVAYFDVPIISSGAFFNESLDLCSVKLSFAIPIAAAGPMLFELLIDCSIALQASKKKTTSTNPEEKIRFFIQERFVLVCALILPGVIFYGRSAEKKIEANVVVGLLVMQRVFIMPPTLIMISSCNPHFMPAVPRLILNVCNTIIHLSSPFWVLDSVTGKATFSTAMICLIICVLILIVLVTRFLISVLLKTKRIFAVTYEDLMAFAFIFTIIIYTISLYLCMRHAFEDYDKQALIKTSIALTMMCFVPASLPGRTARNKYAHTEKLLDLKQHFVRYISHEMRTPMNVASVGIDLLDSTLQDAGVTNPDALERIADVKDAIAIAIEILNDILTYEKISSNLMVLEKCTLDPMRLVTSSFRMFQQEAIKKGIALTVPGPGSYEDVLLGGRTIMGDEKKLGQVFRNLASNALKFTPSGGSVTVIMSIRHTKNIEPATTRSIASPGDSGQGTFHSMLPVISEYRPVNAPINNSSASIMSGRGGGFRGKEYLQIDVIDSGAGIAPHNIGKVFNEIIQFDANKLQGGKGSGLGLYISRGIVELHDGSVCVRSEGLGRGCKFSVVLPLEPMNFQQHSVESSRRASFNRPWFGNQVLPSSMNGESDSVQSFDRSLRLDSPRGALPLSAVREIESHTNSSLGQTIELGDGCPHVQPFSTPSILSTEIPVGELLRSNSGASQSDNTILGSRFVVNDAMMSGAQNAVRHSADSSRRSSEFVGVELTGPVPWTVNNASDPMSSSSSTTNVPYGRLVSIPPRSQLVKCDLTGKRVLLVDDAAINLKIVSVVMKKLGAICETAGDGARAVELVRASLQPVPVPAPGTEISPLAIPLKYDFVIMDNYMPLMNGPEACREMRKMGYVNPIFGLTGDCAAEDVEIFIQAGALYVFQKPFDVNMMKSILSKYVPQ